MAHTAGLGTHDGAEGPLLAARCERPADAVARIAEGPLLFEPGTRYQFSKYSWIPVSAAVETAAGQPFLGAMRDQIFEPLGMTATNAELSTVENPDRIGEPAEDPPPAQFIRDWIIRPLGFGRPKPASELTEYYNPRFGLAARYGSNPARPQNLSCYAGAMAFFSSPSDLVRFGLALAGGRLLQPGTLQILQTPDRLASGQETGHGLGWDPRSVALSGDVTPALVSDGDLFGGKVASTLIVPSRGVVVAVMANLAGADTTDLAERIAAVFAERPR
jgi:CubicO group peptidase (beta-lactamase class C family)